MIQRIHIFGASGSGTTTLAKSVADETGFPHLDTDDIFWIRTNPPFRIIRERAERQELLRQALERTDSWVLAGSLCGWGDFAIPMFDLVVFLRVPSDTRIQRLKKREIDRYGAEIQNPDDPRHEIYKGFLEWAAAYDTGGLDMRSKAMHEKWLSELATPFLRIEGTQSIEENTRVIMQKVKLSQSNASDG
ncbi:MAG: AAA family ATPase [Candidatus Aegiribacteria sp.]|nr:AAA family ATPase [Candidatus Aegiribacteria sp.]